MAERTAQKKKRGKRSLLRVIDRVIVLAKADRVTLDDLVRTIGYVSFSPLLLVPALALATPLSGIPLFSTIMGVLIFLVSAQMVLHREHLWLPAWLLRLQVSGARLKSAFMRTRSTAAWLDRRTGARFTFITYRPLSYIPLVLCLVSGLALPLLEFVPFSSSLVGLAIALMAFGLMARDGLIVLIGLVPYVGIGWLIARFL